jgi:hypothetical protein
MAGTFSLYQSPINAGNYNDGPLNLHAPCEKDTVSVHAGGHAVIQWKENNPGFGFSPPYCGTWRREWLW